MTELKEKSGRSASNPAIPAIKPRRLSATAEDLKEPSKETKDLKTSKKPSIYRSLREHKSRLRPSVFVDTSDAKKDAAPAPAPPASPAAPPDEFSKKLSELEKKMQEKKASKEASKADEKREKKDKKDKEKKEKEKKEKEKKEKKDKEKADKEKEKAERDIAKRTSVAPTATANQDRVASPRRAASPSPAASGSGPSTPNVATASPTASNDSVNAHDSPSDTSQRKAEKGFLSHLFKSTSRASGDGPLSPIPSNNNLSTPSTLSPHTSSSSLNPDAERATSPSVAKRPSRTDAASSGSSTPKRDMTPSSSSTNIRKDGTSRDSTPGTLRGTTGGTLRGAAPSLTSAVTLDEFVPLPEDAAEPGTKKRNMVLNELMRTERDYIRDLTLCRTVCALPLKERGLLSDEDFTAVFSNLDMLLAFNTILFNDLAGQMKNNQGDGVGKAFLKLADFLKMYSAYCTNHTQAVSRLRQLQEAKPEITTFLAQKREAELRGHDIESFLIKPIQRLCRYPLLLKEIIKNTPATHADYQPLSDALTRINEAVAKVNDFKGKAENAMAIVQIQQKVQNAPGLVVPGRRLIREGAIRELCGKEVEKIRNAQFYLFSDILMVARVKEKKQSGWTSSSAPPQTYLKFEDSIPVQIMMLTDLPDGATKNAFEIFCMKLGGQSTRRVFFCAKKEDKEEWIASLQKQAGEGLLYEEREEDLEGSRLQRPTSTTTITSSSGNPPPSTPPVVVTPAPPPPSTSASFARSPTPTSTNTSRPPSNSSPPVSLHSSNNNLLASGTTPPSSTATTTTTTTKQALPPVVPPKPKITFIRNEGSTT